MKFYKLFNHTKRELSIESFPREELEYVLAERIIINDKDKYEIVEETYVEDQDFNS